MLRQIGLKQRPGLHHVLPHFIPKWRRTDLRRESTATSKEHEDVHDASPKIDELDRYLEDQSKVLAPQKSISLQDLYQQYLNEAGNVVDRVVPYEERPHSTKRADAASSDYAESNDHEGDGLVLVVHAQLDSTLTHLEKTTVCSGFVVNASVNHSHQGDTIVTCAHTLEEV